jgi:hypothetical protein
MAARYLRKVPRVGIGRLIELFPLPLGEGCADLAMYRLVVAG